MTTNEPIEATFAPVEKGELVSEALAIPNDAGMLFPASTPAERVSQMVETARVFVGLARDRDAEARKAGHKPLIIVMKDKRSGIISEHLTVPLWRTLGALLPRSVTATTVSTEEIPNGFKAQAAVRLLNGTILGYANARCTRDEGFWSQQPANAVESMAQTRAQGKAFRSVLDFLVILAGFNPTPAEEMPRDGDAPPAEPPPKPAKKPRGKVTDEERQRVVRRIFALASDYAELAGERGEELKARLSDKAECTLPERETCPNARHRLFESMYGKHRLRDLDPHDLHDFTGKLERRIDEAKAQT